MQLWSSGKSAADTSVLHDHRPCRKLVQQSRAGHARLAAPCRMPSHITPASRQTVDTPVAAGSEGDFTDLPKNRDEILVTSPVTSQHMREHIDLVKKDFPLIFKDIFNKDNFEFKIYFRDPITRVSNRPGYFAVVQFLRYFLAPIYEVHEVKQVGEQEILVKWSWTMNFWWNRYLPSKFFWDPQLVFTGVTLLGYNAASGKWNKHVDAWDAIEHQEFPSLEGFLYAFGQMLQLNRPPPNRLTPEFQIWKRYKDWEIRRYRPFITAEISLQELTHSCEAVGSGPGIQAEAQRAQRAKAETLLERYLALGNSRQEFFELPTPLFRTNDNVFSYMVPGYKTVEDLPEPTSPLVKLRQHPEAFYAVDIFGGRPDEKELYRRLRQLQGWVKQEGSRVRNDTWIYARYTKESWVPGPFCTNNVLIPLEKDSLDLWRGVDMAYINRIIAHKV